MFFQCKYLSNVKLFSYFFLLSMFCFPCISFSENITFKYEGFIEDMSGIPVNQTIKMRFSIIDNKGLSVWTRERFVSIQDGQLSVVLGKVIPLNKSFFNGNFYISTKIIDNKKEKLFIRPKLTLSQSISNALSLSNDISNSLNKSNKNTNISNIIEHTKYNENMKIYKQTEFAVPLSYNPNEVSFTIYDDGEHVGIGTNNPKTKLQVKGEIQIGSTNIDCNVDVEGSMRYNKITNEMEFCDGLIWKSFCNRCIENNDHLRGLVAYYPLDSNGNDLSGNNNHGELMNGVTFENGLINKALLCDGKNDYIHINNNDLIEKSHISLQAWIKSSNPGRGYIVSKGAENCFAASYAFYPGSGGLNFYVFNKRKYILSNNAGKKIWDNNWHHIIGTYDGKTVRLFVDGKEVGQGVNTSININYNLSNTNDLFIGTYLGTCKLFFKGYIDDVAIWNRALNDSEVKTLYNTGSGIDLQ